MTFQNYRIFSPEEMKKVQESYPSNHSPLPSSLQVGQKAKYWVWDPDNPNATAVGLPCVVIRVEFGTIIPGCGVRYGLAFEIAMGYWLVLDHIRGNVTPDTVTTFDIERDVLIEMDSKLEAQLRRTLLSVAPGDYQQQEKTPPKGDLSLIGKPTDQT